MQLLPFSEQLVEKGEEKDIKKCGPTKVVAKPMLHYTTRSANPLCLTKRIPCGTPRVRPRRHLTNQHGVGGDRCIDDQLLRNSQSKDRLDGKPALKRKRYTLVCI